MADINLASVPVTVAPPRIVEIDPAVPVADPGNADQWLTVIGEGFVDKPTVVLQWTGQPRYVLPAARVEYVGSTRLRIRLRFGAEADDWTIQLVNPDGHSSNVKAFHVRSQVVESLAPVITEVLPRPLRADAGNAFQEVEIRGANFLNPAIMLTWTGQPGYRLPANRIVSTAGSLIKISIRLGAESDHWTVQVVNADGKPSNVTPFDVLAPEVTVPVVTRIGPGPLIADPQNASQTVSVYGDHFTPGLEVHLSWTGQLDYVLPANRLKFVSASELTLDLHLGGEGDKWSVQLRLPDGRKSAPFAFEVLPPAIVPPVFHHLSILAAGGHVGTEPDLPEYQFGASVLLTALPDEGYEFAGWAGDFEGNENPLGILMEADRTIIARFVPIALPGQLELLGVRAGTVELRLTGTGGHVYTIQGSSDLRTWRSVSVVPVPDSGVVVVRIPSGNLDAQFFRADVAP